MDLYCRRCGEPYELDYVQHDMNVIERTDFKAGRGCPCCKGKEVKERPAVAECAGVLMDILGDDLDGVAAELEDNGF